MLKLVEKEDPAIEKLIAILSDIENKIESVHREAAVMYLKCALYSLHFEEKEKRSIFTLKADNS